MAIIKSFRDLRAYQQAREEASLVFVMTKSFPLKKSFR